MKKIFYFVCIIFISFFSSCKKENVSEEPKDVFYNVSFVENGNQVRVKYLRTGTETDWIVPMEYVPSQITDYVNETYPGAKINEVSIVDFKNKKTYHAKILTKKKESKVLEFDLSGDYKSDVN